MKPFLLSLLVTAGAALAQVPWSAQTSPIPSSQAGDPAFLVGPTRADGGVGLIIGTDLTQVGIYSWSTGGDLQQVLPVGQVLSADARGSVAVVTTALNAVLLYEVTDAGLTPLSPASTNILGAGQVALRELAGGGFEVWVGTGSLTVEHFLMSEVLDGGVSLTNQPSFSVPQVPTGLVADERTGRVYAAQPTLGVLALEPDGGSAFVIALDGGSLGPLVGGLSLFLASDGGALLFSASPSTDEIAVHAIAGTQSSFQAKIQIGDPNGGSQLVRSPQYLELYQRALPGFPKGLLVVHDGLMANYKVVSLLDVDAVIPLPDSPFPDPTQDGGVDAGRPGVIGGPRDGGRPGGLGTSAQPQPTCGCSAPSLALLPGLAVLCWIRRRRS